MAEKQPKTKKMPAGDKIASRQGIILSQTASNKLKNQPSANFIVLGKALEKGGFKKVAVISGNEKRFNINTATHPLDIYLSPYRLDLSQVRYIERVKSNTQDIKISYENLPAGEILNQWLIFEFWSWEKSEIICWLSYCLKKAGNILVQPFKKIDFSAKLPLYKGQMKWDDSNKWQEVTLVNLVVFLAAYYVRIYVFLSRLAWEWRQNWLSRNKKDELVNIKAEFELNLAAKIVQEPSVKKMVKSGSTLLKEKKKSQVKISWPKISWPRVDFGQLISRLNATRSNIFQTQIFSLRQFSYKPVIVFILLALMIALPVKMFDYWNKTLSVKGQVLGEAEQALGELRLAQNSLTSYNFAAAKNYFELAGKSFVSAKNQLDEIKSFLTILAEIVPSSNSYKSGKNILELGEHLSNIGEHLLKSTNDLIATDISLPSRLKNFKIEANAALAELQPAQKNLSNININHLPAENRNQFLLLKKNLPLFIDSLGQAGEAVDFAVNFLGDKELKRYLVVFQNDNELRATGGFMGSFALVDIQDGQLKNINLPQGGTYDVRAGFNELVRPPEPLSLVSNRWEFQDANWWPDFPTSAKNIKWFYNKSGGPTVDGVIAVNSDWLGSLLKIVGPIVLPEYKITIDSENFETEIQKNIELKKSPDNKPKKILADLAPKLLDAVFTINSDKFLQLTQVISDGLANKDILVYMTDDQAQQFIAENNWDGRLKEIPTKADYFNLVATNIGGGKTDNSVRQKVYHQAEVLSDGSVIDKVVINRYHFGPIDEYFSSQANNSYLRVYVPLGSQLIKAIGFKRPDEKNFKKSLENLSVLPQLSAESNAIVDEQSQTRIYNESNKTVFANWSIVGPGETNNILLIYKLPFKVDLQPSANPLLALFNRRNAYYGLLTQIQAGATNGELVCEIKYPAGYSAKTVYPAPTEQDNSRVVFDGNFNKDSFYLVGLSR